MYTLIRLYLLTGDIFDKLGQRHSTYALGITDTRIGNYQYFVSDRKQKIATYRLKTNYFIGGGRGGNGTERPVFQTKSRKQMQTCSQYSIWFIQYHFKYVIARKVRKCPLSPFVTSNVVLSYLVRMADILARLAQKADSLSALQLTDALWYSLSNTPTTPPIHPYPQAPPPPPPPPPHPTFWTAPPPLYLDISIIVLR